MFENTSVVLLQTSDALSRVLNSLNTLFDNFLLFGSNLLIALLILLIGWIMANFISRIVARVLKKIGVEKLGDRLNRMEFIHNMKVKIQPVTIVKKLVYWMLMLIFIMTATETLGQPQLSAMVGKVVYEVLPNILIAMVMMGFGLFLGDTLKTVVANACKSFGVPSWKIISNLVFYLILLMVTIAALTQIGIDTSIITDNFSILIAGTVLAFAVAYGFAARNVLASILTGFYSKGNFELGQIIELDQYKGTIAKMDNVSVTLDTGTEYVVFPLHRLLSDKVIIHQQKEG